jgi:hypothetical protein
MLKPALNSTDGHQRRKQQLDSLRTFLLAALPVSVTGTVSGVPRTL